MTATSSFILLCTVCIATALRPDPCVPALLQFRAGSWLQNQSGWQQLKLTTTFGELKLLNLRGVSVNSINVIGIELDHREGINGKLVDGESENPIFIAHSTGTIPDFSQCTAVETANLSFNCLSGK